MKLFLASSIFNVIPDVVRQLGRSDLKLTFIFTAAEAAKNVLWHATKDRESLKNVGFEVTDYTITGKTKEQVREELQKTDIIFFAGGNIFYLLQQIQQSDCGDVIRELVKEGKTYIGSSAGATIAGPDVWPAYRSDSAGAGGAPDIKGYAGLGLVDFVVFSHWGNPLYRDLYFGQRLEHAYTDKHKIILLTDNQYIAVEDEMYKIIDAGK